MIRPEINQLIHLGKFPASPKVVPEVIRRQEELLGKIKPPVTNDEARELVKLFGPDVYYGGAWTLLHLVESAPQWPLTECLSEISNEWIARLKERAVRKAGRTELPGQL
jgi:hypothetical protein